MGFRKRNANRSDNRSKTKVIMGKPASIQKKYDKLCEEFEELQENYNDLFDDYYEV